MSLSAATAFLWWTYIDMKTSMNKQMEVNEIPILDIQIDSEKAFLIYSIIASVLTVSIYV